MGIRMRLRLLNIQGVHDQGRREHAGASLRGVRNQIQDPGVIQFFEVGRHFYGLALFMSKFLEKFGGLSDTARFLSSMAIRMHITLVAYAPVDQLWAWPLVAASILSEVRRRRYVYWH